jgi:hypothetical protein
MLDNVQSTRVEGSGHRNGPPMAANADQARMEPWCKRPRRALVTLLLVNPIWSKTEENAAAYSAAALARGAFGLVA